MLPDPPVEDRPPPLPIPERRGQLEVDTFCVGCGYNLHGQPVTVDDRLNLPVCRCPECGRFHPAGMGVSASSVWVRRLGTFLLFNWVVTVLVAAVAICFFLGLLSAATVGVYEHSVQATPDGQEVEYRPVVAGKGAGTYRMVIKGTNTPVGRVIRTARLYPFRIDPAKAIELENLSSYEREAVLGPGPWPALFLTAGSLALGGLAGLLCATLMWHWPRPQYAWCLLLAVLPAGFLVAIYSNADEFMFVRGEAVSRTAGQFVVQEIGIGLGVLLGRPVVRAVLRTVIPPKPRQTLAFLWQVDGKQLPM